MTDVHLPPLPGEDAVVKVRSALPSLPHLAFIAGLGVMGVFSILGWPVVLAVGVGAALTEQLARTFLVHVPRPAGDGDVASHLGDQR
ncbi:hypothetical protein [Kutzneria sp. CA-103260]|uniref:hypothetical protein n=1 Tax=Kutzneria sp. CA-103260 TaxID=2802641 RepID=UPI001BA60376|nr:hypothetical protein [Kutzneria sp. CA-103260]